MGKKVVALSVKIDFALDSRLDDFVENSLYTKSEVIRDALYDYLFIQLSKQRALQVQKWYREALTQSLEDD